MILEPLGKGLFRRKEVVAIQSLRRTGRLAAVRRHPRPVHPAVTSNPEPTSATAEGADATIVYGERGLTGDIKTVYDMVPCEQPDWVGCRGKVVDSRRVDNSDKRKQQ
jgi:hypothetical protein